MFKASSLLLLTLVLNVQLCSLAPIPAKVVQSSSVAEEPGPEELAPVTEDHSHFIEEKESVQEKLIPVVAGEAAPSPDESPAEEDIPVIAKEPEPVFIGDQVSDDADEAVSQESAPQEPQEHVKEEDAVAPVVLEDSVEMDPVTNEELLPSTLEEEESVALIPAELETEEAGHGVPAAEETALEESAPEEPAEEELDQEEQEETVPIISSETREEEAPEEHANEEDTVSPVVLEENAEVDPATNEELLPNTLEEEESVALFPVELEAEEEGQVEPAAQETAPEDSAPEDPVVIVPLDPAEQEPELEEQVKEESIPIVSPEGLDEETPEEYREVEAVSVASAWVPVPIVPEENSEEDPATKEEPLPSTPEEEESVAFVHEELNSEERAPEDPILIIPMEDLEEDAPEGNTEEEVVQSDPLPKEAGLEEDTAPQENKASDSDAEILATSVTETTSETEAIERVLDPDEEAPVAATEVHVATEILTEAPSEPVTAPVPAVTDVDAEIVPAPVEGGNGTSVNTTSEDFKAAVILIEDEPVALVNRGAVLGAAFFTMMSFITIGFVGMTVSKKLR